MNNKSVFRRFRSTLFLITYAIILFVALTNMQKIGGVLGTLSAILSPIIWGCGMAFIFNIPMTFFERRIFAPFSEKHPKFARFKKTAAITFTMVLFFAILFTLISFILPSLYDSLMMLRNTLENSGDTILKWLEEITAKFNISNEYLDRALDQVNQQIYNFTSNWSEWLTNSIPTILDTIMNMTSAIFNFIMSFFLALYILSNKDHLKRGARRTVYALFNDSHAKYITHVIRVAANSFANFISGFVTEAFIQGSLCFVGMLILRLPQALLISVIVTLFALIPFFGGIISTVIGTLLLLFIDPGKALVFLIFITILQQIEGNFIYPKVVGNSIGLNPLWVLMAVVVGGNVSGFFGMILGIPTFSTFYTLYKEFIEKKEKQKSNNVVLLKRIKSPVQEMKEATKDDLLE